MPELTNIIPGLAAQTTSDWANTLPQILGDSNVRGIMGALTVIPLLVGLVYLCLFGILCHKLAGKKGYNGYFWTGFFLHFLGFLYVIGLPDRGQTTQMIQKP